MLGATYNAQKNASIIYLSLARTRAQAKLRMRAYDCMHAPAS